MSSAVSNIVNDEQVTTENMASPGPDSAMSSAVSNIVNDEQVTTENMPSLGPDSAMSSAVSNIVNDEQVTTVDVACLCPDSAMSSAVSNIVNDEQVTTEDMASLGPDSAMSSAVSNIVNDGQVTTEDVASLGSDLAMSSAVSNIVNDEQVTTEDVASFCPDSAMSSAVFNIVNDEQVTTEDVASLGPDLETDESMLQCHQDDLVTPYDGTTTVQDLNTDAAEPLDRHSGDAVVVEDERISVEDVMIPCLGRSFKLGDRFNLPKHELLSAAGHKCPNPTIEKCESSLTQVCDANKITQLFGVDELTELQILSDSLSVAGAATFVKEVLSSHKETNEIALLYTVTSAKHCLSQQEVQNLELDEDGEQTHIVSAVEYGAQVLFLFKWDDKAKRPRSLAQLKKIIEKIPQITSANSGKVEKQFTVQERACHDDIIFRIFSDIPVTKPPKRFSDCIPMQRILPSFLGKHGQVPLRIWLRPLTSHAERIPTIPSLLCNAAKQLLLKLLKFNGQCQDFISSEAAQLLPQLKQKFLAFQQVSFMFAAAAKSRLSTHLIDIFNGQDGYILLEKLLKEIESSPFNTDLLEYWSTEQEELLKLISTVKKNSTNYRAAKLTPPGQSLNMIKSSTSDNVAVFRLGTMTEEWQHLNNMVAYLRNADNEFIDAIDDLETLVVYDGSTASLKEKLSDFVFMFSEGGKTAFLLTDDVPENGCTNQTQLYVRGKLMFDNFIPPTKPDKPDCLDISHNRMTLSWTVHKQKINIEKYEVAYKICYTQNWKTKTVEGNCNEAIISDLDPGTEYVAKVRSITKFGASAYSPVLVALITSPMAAPGKPLARQVSQNGCVVAWSKPMISSKCNLTNWEIVIESAGIESIITVSYSKFNHHIEIVPGNTYIFRVRSCCKVFCSEEKKKISVKSQSSDASDPVIMDATLTQIIKNRAVMGSEIVRRAIPSIYNLPLRDDYHDNQQQIRKVSYGKPNDLAPMKTILVVGATGAGKSTLVNAFVNYVMDVKWEDDFRFRLIHEDMNANQARSQTKWVTSYILHHQESFLVPYSLNIIDTPGFGDTAGIVADQRITKQLSDYFHAKGHEGIDSLDAIAFVVQASLARLTPTQCYIFDSILALFGKDVAENIFVLITFADGQKPPVIQGLKEAKLPYTQAFKFNNSALFAERQCESKIPDDSSDEEGDETFDKMFWDMGAISYKKFLSHLAKTKSKSLTLTNAVLDEREHLQTHVSGIHQQVREGLSQLEELKAGMRCLSDHVAEIDRNKDFCYEVNIEKSIKVDLPPRTYVTNCLTCNRTCHYPCGIPNDDGKHGCAAMTIKNGDSFCHVCPTECHWSVHFNSSYRYELQNTIEKKTASDLKAKYEEASNEKLTTEQVISKIVDEIEAREVYTAFLTNEVRTSLEKLNLIALKPSHLTTIEYINVLIQSERSQAHPGWPERIRQLEAVRAQAATLEQIAKQHGVTEPWDRIRQSIKEEQEKGRPGFFSSSVDFIRRFFSRH